MQYTYLGRSGLKVSRLCLGTMNFGPHTDEKDAYRVMDAALAAGINFWDTANVYGGEGKRGWTEEILGRYFCQGNNRRERVVLATKVYGEMEDELDGPNGENGLSAYKIRRHLISSLRRLQTDRVELYQMHHIDRNVRWEEIWEVFDGLIHQGVVDYVGSSNFAGWHLVDAQHYAADRHMLGIVSEQHRYNLLCRLPEMEVLPAAQHLQVGLLTYSPLAGGLLSGKLDAADPRSRGRRQKLDQRTKEQLEQFAQLCRDLGQPEAVVAVAWLLHQPAVTSVIIGPRTLGQLEQVLTAVELKLDEETLARLDQIFPGPGGPAPECYAW